MRLMKIPTVWANDAGASPNRRKWGLFLFVSALAISGLIGLSTSKTGGSGIAAMLADPLSVLAGRSPGGRGPGALTSTKPSFAVLPSVRSRPKPSERVLSTVRERPPAATGIDEFAPLGLALSDLPPGNFIPQEGGSGSPLPFLAGPPGSGGGGLPLDDTPDLISPVTSVPEPETWFTMILGFFVMGTVLRKSRTLSMRGGSAASVKLALDVRTPPNVIHAARG